MRAFAQWTKLSGTAEERQSFIYLEQRMKELGFRTTLIEHDALISLPGPASVQVGNQALTCITHSFSRPSPADGLQGRLVDVGEGTPPEVAGKDLRGAILLVAGIASPAVAAVAAQAGAAGQLHVSPAEHLHEMCISPVWGSPAPDALADLPQTVACTISNTDGAALRARLAAKEQVEATLHAKVDTGWRKTPILVADLDGSTADAAFILLSGHHDTWYLGVMDNGGANAAMIEVARVCAAARETWRRGLRVCFWSGHSHGRYSGSTWYVDQFWDELDRRCAAHVNLDSCGGIHATVMTESAVSVGLAGLAREAVAAETGDTHLGRRVGRNSDQSFFGIGIPSMFGSVSHQPPSPVKMRNALGWWWHTPHDTLDKIDPAFLARDTRVALRATRTLLTAEVLPIDLGAQAEALRTFLKPIAAKIGNAVKLDDVFAALDEFATAAEGAAADVAIMRACRALVPLDYTTGDRFGHDPALPIPAWAALAPLTDLARCEAGTVARYSAVVAATRARNRLLHALRMANEALATCSVPERDVSTGVEKT